MGEPTMRILSLGAGVQSTTLALMACEGTLPGLDAAIFADTGWEPKAVYQQVDRLEIELKVAGIPIYRVSNGNLRDDTVDISHRFASIPWYVKNPDGSKGLGRRQCTHEYKLKPIRRKIRELLGAEPPKFQRVPRGRITEQWIGFSYDEIHRINDKDPNLYIHMRYPLIELKMDRRECQRWLKRRGWDDTVKSSCIGCPFNGNKQWRDMRDNRPDEWADAVEFDRQIRDGGAKGAAMKGQAYLHNSLLPLDQAPIDKWNHEDWGELQMDFDDLNEDGDPDGCSPYGCRSGKEVTFGERIDALSAEEQEAAGIPLWLRTDWAPLPRSEDSNQK